MNIKENVSLHSAKKIKPTVLVLKLDHILWFPRFLVSEDEESQKSVSWKKCCYFNRSFAEETRLIYRTTSNITVEWFDDAVKKLKPHTDQSVFLAKHQFYIPTVYVHEWGSATCVVILFRLMFIIYFFIVRCCSLWLELMRQPPCGTIIFVLLFLWLVQLWTTYMSSAHWYCEQSVNTLNWCLNST